MTTTGGRIQAPERDWRGCVRKYGFHYVEKVRT
jgi:hypothetical protein